MADEQTLPLPAQTNGFHPDMDDEELLTELSSDTIQPSYGYVKLKFTQGDKEIYKRLKVQTCDVVDVVQLVTNRLPKATRQHILAETKGARSQGYTDDNWLQSLALCCQGLCPPVVITDPVTHEVVWRAGGEPQDLPAAMIALCRLGFTFWHIEDIVNRIGSLTRIQQDAQSQGNS